MKECMNPGEWGGACGTCENCRANYEEKSRELGTLAGAARELGRIMDALKRERRAVYRVLECLRAAGADRVFCKWLGCWFRREAESVSELAMLALTVREWKDWAKPDDSTTESTEGTEGAEEANSPSGSGNLSPVTDNF